MIGASFHAIGLRSGSLDPLTVAYAAASGATDLAGIDKVIRYVRAESLLSNFVMYPMKSAQNAGTGATAYGLGGLTSNEMTLVNGPTWGASGLAFASASSQYAVMSGNLPAYRASDGVAFFARFAKTTESNSDTFSSTNPESLASITTAGSDTLVDAGSVLRIIGGRLDHTSRNSADTAFLVTRATNHSIDTQDVCAVVVYDSGGGNLYLDKTEVTYSNQNSGTTEQVTGPLALGTQNVELPARFFDGTYKAFGMLTVAITDTQRETITDLINAL
jgi:hypothetical protein